MRLMIFYDVRNFEGSIKERDEKRVLTIRKAQKFFIKKLNQLLELQITDADLIRAYAYNGEFTQQLIKRAEADTEKEKDLGVKEKKEKFLEYVKKQREKQQDYIKRTNAFNFFELRMLPLHYSPAQINVFQKGVDVQLAVDLVSHAFKNNFDVALLFSGDIDLQKSIEQVKELGKKVIVVSHPNNMSKQLIKHADYFINLKFLSDEELDEFTKKYQPQNKPTKSA